MAGAGRERGEDPAVIACVGARIRDLPAGTAARILEDMDDSRAAAAIERLIENCRLQGGSVGET